MATLSITISENVVFPVAVHSWTVTKIDHHLIATSSSKASGKNVYRFPFKDGTLFLYNGNAKKYAYFRDMGFQNFLLRHGITAVKREDPNQSYSVRSHEGGNGRIGYALRTDGVVKTERTGGLWDNMKDIGNACYDSSYLLHVSGASWVIVSTFNHCFDNHSSAAVLYTLKRVEDLVIPKC